MLSYMTFEQACSLVLDQKKVENGIGTLAEKTIHAVLKAYYAPDSSCCERKVSGFVADICDNQEIIEIQTRNFGALRRKLNVFLPNYHVTIVYPVAHKKWLRWINPESGEISPRRKSPKTGTPYAVFQELFWIKEYLTDPHLHLKIVLLDVEEYRVLDGWSMDKKKGSTRNDGIPVALEQEVIIQKAEDYSYFIPKALPEEFTVKEYRQATGLSLKTAGDAVNVLKYLKVIQQSGKQGRAFVYRRCLGHSGEVQESLLTMKKTEQTVQAKKATISFVKDKRVRNKG